MLIAAANSIHAVRWAKAYADLEHEVYFVAIKGHEMREDGDKFPTGVNIHYLPFGGTKGYFLNAPILHKLWKRFKPDVVNVHYASGYGTLARLSHIHPYVLSVWGSDVYDFSQKGKINKRFVIKNLLCADAIASTSYVMAEQVRGLLNDSNYPITITPFGVNTKHFTPDGEAVPPKKENQFLFGTVKTFTYIYGIDYILRAFRLFLNQWQADGNIGKTPHLFICGKGKNRLDFEKLRDELGLQEYVDIHGYIPNEKIPMLLRSFDVFVLGSVVNESFGVAAVEAMSCGLPLIATDVDGFREVMVDGETGYIVPRKNVAAMVKKMWELYQNKELREKMGKNGRTRVLQLYDWSDNVQILVNLLKNTAGLVD